LHPDKHAAVVSPGLNAQIPAIASGFFGAG
jgi:hypothetical protein